MLFHVHRNLVLNFAAAWQRLESISYSYPDWHTHQSQYGAEKQIILPTQTLELFVSNPEMPVKFSNTKEVKLFSPSRQGNDRFVNYTVIDLLSCDYTLTKQGKSLFGNLLR